MLEVKEWSVFAGAVCDDAPGGDGGGRGHELPLLVAGSGQLHSLEAVGSSVPSREVGRFSVGQSASGAAGDVNPVSLFRVDVRRNTKALTLRLSNPFNLCNCNSTAAALVWLSSLARLIIR